MGFLLGAYGKLAAGSRYRSLQARMMRIQSKIRRATRDVAQMEKFIDRRQKQLESQYTTQNTMAKSMYQQQMQTSMYANADYKAALEKYNKEGATPEEQAAASNRMTQIQAGFNSLVSAQCSQADMNLSTMKMQIENEIEYLRDTLLEPLKDEEDSLQLEKDTLESQIQVAKADYEACQKMEQADVKMLTPNYTGGQG